MAQAKDSTGINASMMICEYLLHFLGILDTTIFVPTAILASYPLYVCISHFSPCGNGLRIWLPSSVYFEAVISGD